MTTQTTTQIYADEVRPLVAFSDFITLAQKWLEEGRYEFDVDYSIERAELLVDRLTAEMGTYTLAEDSERRDVVRSLLMMLCAFDVEPSEQQRHTWATRRR